VTGAFDAPVLAVDGLRVVRGGRTLVDVDRLEVQAGAFVAIVGPNGAGKSSVLRAVTGEWAAVGSIDLFGRPLRAWPRLELARRLAVMSQSSHLSFEFTVEEVVTLGRLPHRGESAAHARAAADAAIAALELSAQAGRIYTTLSGGERQRVQFARVLAQLWGSTQPRLLLLDEPTSALDLRQQRAVLDLAWQASREGASVVAVMHDLNLAARYADRVCMMSDGVIRARGTPAECFTPSTILGTFGVHVLTELARSDGLPMVLPCAPSSR
jgi:iron complex transport system ATP-binding protein